MTHLRQLMLEEPERRQLRPEDDPLLHSRSKAAAKEIHPTTTDPSNALRGRKPLPLRSRAPFPRKQLHPYPYCYYWSPFVPPQRFPFTPPLTLASNWRPITGAKGIRSQRPSGSYLWPVIVNELLRIKTPFAAITLTKRSLTKEFLILVLSAARFSRAKIDHILTRLAETISDFLCPQGRTQTRIKLLLNCEHEVAKSDSLKFQPTVRFTKTKRVVVSRNWPSAFCPRIPDPVFRPERPMQTLFAGSAYSMRQNCEKEARAFYADQAVIRPAQFKPCCHSSVQSVVHAVVMDLYPHANSDRMAHLVVRQRTGH